MTAPWPAEPPGPARRAGGLLSLRARLLVLLICVTAAFLLIMGAVGTIVLCSRLGSKFNTQLVAAAQHSPRRSPATPATTWPSRSPPAPCRSAR